MKARSMILTIGAVMVTAGVLIELTGSATSNHTAADEPNPISRPPATPSRGNSGHENPLPPAAPATTVRPGQVRADDPYDAVQRLYRAIADNESATGCAVFTKAAVQQFAAHFNAPDCPAALTQLATHVTDKSSYASTALHSPGVYPEDTIIISSCEIKPAGGPPLGRFTLHRIAGYWYISGHEREIC